MSGSEFHVHGPHEHVLEHAAEVAHHSAAGHGTVDHFSGRIAVTTALLATIGALFAYEGGATQSNALLYKNNAAIKKTEASNQWNYYQVHSNRQNLADLGALLTSGDKAEQFRLESERYKKEKTEFQVTALRLESEAKGWESALGRRTSSASPLGASHDRTADRNRDGGHRVADATQLASVCDVWSRCRRWCAGGTRSHAGLSFRILSAQRLIASRH